MNDEYINMTPIELNTLLNKVKENHELIKFKIKSKLDEVEKLEVDINNEIKNLSEIEEKYVDIMSVLIDKK